MAHKAGFVNIIGSPNVGKSTLMNNLVGEQLSIITAKAQTTRHRIMGIVNDENYQIVYSDTPGVLDPKYPLQEGMMRFVSAALADADVILLVVDVRDKGKGHAATMARIKQMDVPIVVLVNKIDLLEQKEIEASLMAWQEAFPEAKVAAISALHKFNVKELFDYLISILPESPAYFPKDELTDKPMRFFVSEIIREKILLNYQQEIPYSCEVIVTEYQDQKHMVSIRAEIMVARETQKYIIIGKGGAALKSVGTAARKDIEAFAGKKVFLDLYVKVDKNWREDRSKLKKYGYLE